MTPSDVARSAALLLERGWTATDPATDADGKQCAAWHPLARAWSLVGAVCAVRCPDHLRLSLLGRFKVVHGKTIHEFRGGRDECVEALRRCTQD